MSETKPNKPKKSSDGLNRLACLPRILDNYRFANLGPLMQQNSIYYSFLVLLCLCLYLPGIASLPMVDRDSPHFSQATKQMLQTGNYLQVKFQNHPRHLKPPGYYWLQAMSVKLFSSVKAATNWPYRLPGVLGAILAVLMTFGFAKRYVKKEVALLAAALLASCFLLLIETRLTVTDTLLLATMVLMQGGLWEIYTSHSRQQTVRLRAVLYFWLGMTAGILIKGITPLVGFLTIIGLCIADKNIAWLKKIRFGLGLTLLILLTLAWLVPVSMAGKSNFLFDMVRGDVLPKLAGGQQSHGMPPGYYLLIFSLMFWPASLFVWFGNVWGFRQRKDPTIRFLWAWIIPSWIFFALVPTKLPQYVLPVYPAIAVLTSLGIFARKEFTCRPLTKFLCRLQYVVWALLGLAVTAAVITLPFYLLGVGSVVGFMVAGVVLLTLVLMFYQIYLNEHVKAAWIAVIASIFIFAPVFGVLLPNMRPLWISQRVKTFIQKNNIQLTQSQPLYAVGYGEPSLVFLLGTHKVKFAPIDAAIAALRQQRADFVLCNQRIAADFSNQAKQNGIVLEPIKTVRGFNLGNSRWIQLTLYKKISTK
ncbi:MAG: glycosyltransferase family 39 protein [Pseudomonadota bacterium]